MLQSNTHIYDALVIELDYLANNPPQSTDQAHIVHIRKNLERYKPSAVKTPLEKYKSMLGDAISNQQQTMPMSDETAQCLEAITEAIL